MRICNLDSSFFLLLCCITMCNFVGCCKETMAAEDSLLSSNIFAPTEQWSLDRELETPALNQWRQTAKATGTGEQLLNFLDTVNASLQYNAHDSEALYRRAYLYGLIGCPRLAIRDLNKAINQDPSQSALHRERGVCHVDMQNYEKALSDFNQALNLNPNSGDARLARARLLLQMGKSQQALDDLLVCERGQVEFKPVLPGELSANYYKSVDYYLGACYEALGRKSEAIGHYRESSNIESVPATGAYVHRYADQPTDAADCMKRLQGY